MNAKLKWSIIICMTVTIGITVWLAMHTDDTLKQQILKLQGRHINLSLKNADVYYSGKDTLYNHADGKRLVVYIDSLSCSTCFLNNMMTYYDINDSLVNKGGHFIVILNPKRVKINEIREKVIMDKYPFYCIIDGNNEFFTTNNIPTNSLLHSFMLDKNDKIILVGDPTHNSKIKELFFKQLIAT